MADIEGTRTGANFGTTTLYSIEAPLLSAVVAITTGEKMAIGGINKWAVQVQGITDATVQIETSIDGTNFVKIGSDIIADGIAQVNINVKFVRAKVSAWVSGSITVTFFGDVGEN